MRRPYRTVRDRIERRVTVLARSLPPAPRRGARRLADAAGTGLAGREPVLPRQPSLEIVTGFDAWQTVADLAAELADALHAAGVDFVRLERHGQVVLAVPLEARTAALDELATAAGSRAWWIAGNDLRTRKLDAKAARAVPGPALSVFRLLASPGGTYFGSHQAAVGLHFWRTVGEAGEARPDGGRHPPGTRVAPARNHVAAYLSPAMWEQARTAPGRLVGAERAPHLLDLRQPVDIVYTWVDSGDPRWQQRRAGVDLPDGSAADAVDPARARSHDELRYSLRSVAMYAGWVRHIWLVTDGQVPPWLAEHPRLTVVDHRTVFADPTALPTFNSHAIESQLHHIPGLAEHFLYFNDDVFLGRPVRPELFFHGNGIAKFAVSPISICADPDEPRLNGAMHAARRNRVFLEQTFDRTVTQRMQHTPHAHVRSSLAELEAGHPGLVGQVAGSRFRAVDDVSIASDLGHYWAHARGEAVRGAFAFRYVDIASPHAQEHYDSLLANRNQDCFCLNDVGGDQAVDAAAMLGFLAGYFPIASPFERPA